MAERAPAATPEAGREPVTMEKIVALCKRRGFIFQSSEIYGGLASTYDYGRKGGSGATSEGSSSDGEGKKAESKGSSELKGSESKPSAASSSD